MASLPDFIHKRLSGEFEEAAKRVAACSDLPGKLYYFSVFYGEAGRLLNWHWDADLSLMFLVVQAACGQLANRVKLPETAGFPPDGVSVGLLDGLDQVSAELADAFRKAEVDLPRLYAALARTSELVYSTTGNGAYLAQKGMIPI